MTLNEAIAAVECARLLDLFGRGMNAVVCTGNFQWAAYCMRFAEMIDTETVEDYASGAAWRRGQAWPKPSPK